MSLLKKHGRDLENRQDEVISTVIDSGICINLRRTIRSWFIIHRKHPNTFKYFRSSASLREEQIRHLHGHYITIHPFSIFSLYYDFYVFLMFTTHYIFIPIGDASTVTEIEKQKLSSFKFYISMLHLADICQLFFRGYYDETKSRTVLGLPNIAKRYLRTYFFFDVLSCTYAAVYILGALLKVDVPLKDQFLLKLFNRLKIIRLPRMLNIIEIFGNYMDFPNYLFNGFRLLYAFSIIILWAFSINFAMEYYNSLFIRGKPRSSSKYGIYVTYHEATVMVLLVTTGSKYLYEAIEYVNVTFFMFFGMTLQLYLFAKVLQVWTRYSSSENHNLRMNKQIKEYMKYKGLPPSLQQRILNYFQYKFHKQVFKESDLKSIISPLMKQEILLLTAQRHLENLPLLKDSPEKVLMCIVGYFKEQTYLAGDVIIRAGTIGSCMFFINHGTVAVYARSGKEIRHLEDRDHFGEAVLMHKQIHETTVVAVTITELFALKRSDFMLVISSFPEFRDRLMNMAAMKMKS